MNIPTWDYPEYFSYTYVMLHGFFNPRIVDFRGVRSRDDRLPHALVSNWQDPKPRAKERLLRVCHFRTKQRSSSPLGLSKLPYELLDPIYHDLCGQEIAAMRLVCSEWELASRAFFAAIHLERSVFWLTHSNLRMLERLTERFGSYMQNIYVATDHFTIPGLVQAFRQFLRYRYSHVVARHYDFEEHTHDRGPKSVLEIKAHYLGQWFKQQEWHTYCDTKGSARFFWHFTRHIVSQAYLRRSRADLKRLTNAVGRLRNCDVNVVSLSYEPGQLNINAYAYGKPAPEHAFELALFCSHSYGTFDNAYYDHVGKVVEEALERRNVLTQSVP